MLPVIRANASFDIFNTLPLVAEGSVGFDRIMIFCRNYRRRGICSLFAEGSAGLFHKDLQRSGAAFLHFLKRAPESEKRTGKSAPFFDSIACADHECARAIARHSRRTWNEGEEYEDDYLYLTWLMSRFCLGSPEETMRPILERYRALLEGAPDARFDLCRSFAENDERLFSRSLNALLHQHEDFYRQGMARDEILDEEWQTEGKISIEGLALVRLAELLGLATDTDHLFVPSIARMDTGVIFDPDSWRNSED